MGSGGGQFDCPSDDQVLFNKKVVESPKASDAVVSIAHGIFFAVFFSVVYYLIIRWRDKTRNSTPLLFVTMFEMVAIITFVASCIYLLVYFGNSLVHHTHFSDDEEDEELEETTKNVLCEELAGHAAIRCASLKQAVKKDVEMVPTVTEDEEEVIQAVVSGKTPSYSLESKLGDCKRAAFIRRVALERITGKSLEGLCNTSK